MTRIIAGTFKGRRLQVPARGTRPTSDRTREALFSFLDHAGALRDARVLDLYAGSGALGLEALSRGAREVTAVESASGAVEVCRANVHALDVAAQVRVVRASVATFVAQAAAEPFHLILADPPYDIAEREAQRVLPLLAQGWLAPDGVILWEQAAQAQAPVWPQPWQSLESRRYGDTTMHLAEYPVASPER